MNVRLLSLNVESAALPERLGVIASHPLTILKGKALATYPAMQCFDNRDGLKEHVTLISVFHGGDRSSLLKTGFNQ